MTHITIDNLVDAVSEDMDLSRSKALTAIARFIDEQTAPHSGQMGKSERYIISTWDCDESPIGVCIEDLEDSENCCVFCGDPNERK